MRQPSAKKRGRGGGVSIALLEQQRQRPPKISPTRVVFLKAHAGHQKQQFVLGKGGEITQFSHAFPSKHQE